MSIKNITVYFYGRAAAQGTAERSRSFVMGVSHTLSSRMIRHRCHKAAAAVQKHALYIAKAVLLLY